MNLLSPVDQASDIISREYIDRLTIYKYKSAQQDVSGSTTLVDDTHLSFTSLEASPAVYALDGVLFATGPTAGDLKVNWTIPSGATFNYCFYGQGTGATTGIGSPTFAVQTGSDLALGMIAANIGIPVDGSLVMSSAGTLTLRWAQNAASGTTSLLKGSWLSLRKLT